ncbi:signal peptidase I, partial [Pseudomonas sp. MPR-R2A5]
MKDDLALSTTEAGEPGESERATASPTKPAKTDWASELRGIFWLILAVLGFHTFIA